MRHAVALAALLTLSACTQTNAPSGISESPQTLMVRVARQVQACWFAKKDPVLRPYRMASEVNSYAGRPRILIVPRNRPEGLPQLVAQAERSGGRTQFSTFGPLLQTSDGPRLAASLNGWAQGATSC